MIMMLILLLLVVTVALKIMHSQAEQNSQVLAPKIKKANDPAFLASLPTNGTTTTVLQELLPLLRANNSTAVRFLSSCSAVLWSPSCCSLHHSSFIIHPSSFFLFLLLLFSLLPPSLFI